MKNGNPPQKSNVTRFKSLKQLAIFISGNASYMKVGDDVATNLSTNCDEAFLSDTPVQLDADFETTNDPQVPFINWKGLKRPTYGQSLCILTLIPIITLFYCYYGFIILTLLHILHVTIWHWIAKHPNTLNNTKLDYNAWDGLHLFPSLTSFILVFVLIGIFMDNSFEISINTNQKGGPSYEKLKEMCVEYPSLQSDIDEAMDNGYISNREFAYIEAKYDRMWEQDKKQEYVNTTK